MSLLKLAMAGATGYAMFRIYRAAQGGDETPAAFATGETAPGFANIRNAGPEAMRSDPSHWDRVDEEIDESFPASDPPPMGKR